MLTLGEVHNMGLNRGFRLGGLDYNSILRADNFSLADCGTASLEPGGNMLHPQLNGYMHNSFLHQGSSQQCPALDGESTWFMPTAYGAMTSLGFPQTDMDRSLLYDGLAPIADHDVTYSNATSRVGKGPTPPVAPLAGLEHSTPQTMRPSGSFAPQVARECWGEGSLLTPRGSKRGDDRPDVSNQPRKKPDKIPKNMDAKWKRPMEQAEHIIRERQRRDDMTNKFSVLEGLLPPGAKRDRSTIVDESIEYVKNLHHRINQLHQRKMTMRQATTAALSPQATQQTASTLNLARAGLTLVKGPAEVVQPPNDRRQLMERSSGFQKTPATKEDPSKFHELLKSSLEKLEVHADLPHQVVIEMVCQPQPHFQSHILQCLDSLHLDVVQCSITKVGHRVICVISAKPQEETSQIVSTYGIVAALKYALGASQQLSTDGEDTKS